jgi:hypothetical protein
MTTDPSSSGIPLSSPVAPVVEIDDYTYNRMMDDIVLGTGGNVRDVIAEIERLGLHRPGIGKSLIEDEPRRRRSTRSL